MPIDQVTALRFPEYGGLFDEMAGAARDPVCPDVLATELVASADGTAEMLLLGGLRQGRAEALLRSGVRLGIEFPISLFPTLGIWWNRGGHPDEDGCRRRECALEPIPGTCSSLAASRAAGACLVAPPGETIAWTIRWHLAEVRENGLKFVKTD